MRYLLELADDRLKYAREVLLSRGYEVEDLLEHPKSDDVVVLSPAHKLSTDEAVRLCGACVVFGGRQADDVAGVFSSGKYVNMLKDEEFVRKNSELTVENFLAQLVLNMPSSIYDERILVTGSGHLANAFWKALSMLDIPFTATMRDGKILSLVRHFGVDAIHLDEIGEHVGNFSVIINTIPAVIFDKNIFAEDCTIYELASTRCIRDGLDVKYVPCPALPGKYSPKSAGVALIDVVSKYLNDVHIRKGE